MDKLRRFAKAFRNSPESFLFLGIVLAYSLLRFGSASVDSVRLIQDGNDEGTVVPISRQMDAGERFVVEMDWFPGIFGETEMDIHPDDCVDAMLVDGHPLDLEKYAGHCSWSEGFKVASSDLRKFAGDSARVRLEMHNDEGLAGMQLSVRQKNVPARFLRILLYLLTGTLLVLLLRRMRFSTLFSLILVAGILLRFSYLLNTGYDQRSHDVGGHVAYVQIVAEQHRIPAAGDCWTCYHPPVYYLASSVVWNAASFAGENPQNALQAESFFFSCLTLFLGLLCLEKLLASKKMFLIAGILWSLWPAFLLTSARIGNDQLFYLWHVLCFFLCLMYIGKGNGIYLMGALVAAALAFFTKTTGAVSIAIALATLGWMLWKKRWAGQTLFERIACALGVALVAVIGVFFLTGEVSGNVGGLKGVDVGNALGNYLVFDSRTYLLEPYTSPFDDSLGRQYFWNYLLKTSLFGEFSLSRSPLGLFCASSASVALLVLVAFFARGAFHWKRSAASMLFAWQGFLFLAVAVAFRIKYPFSCSNDFRYIVPVLLSFVPFVAVGVGTEPHRTLRLLGYGVVGVFILSSSVLLLFLL